MIALFRQQIAEALLMWARAIMPRSRPERAILTRHLHAYFSEVTK